MNPDLPTPAGFEGASTFVRPEDVAKQIPCGPDLDAAVQAVQPFWEAGFTDVVIVQVGYEGQAEFLESSCQAAVAETAARRRLTTDAKRRLSISAELVGQPTGSTDASSSSS